MKVEEGLPDNPMDEPVEHRVVRGMDMLDSYGPVGWRSHVNLATLDMSSDTDCVLGQVYGRFSKGMEELRLYSHVEAARMGFAAVRNGGYGNIYMSSSTAPANLALTEEWRRVLAPAEADAA